MKRRFSDRVAVEREVLSLVNSRFKESQLHGLSKAAISSWSHSSDLISDEIINLITDVSKRARLDVDASKDIFVDDELELRSSTKECIHRLREYLK